MKHKLFNRNQLPSRAEHRRLSPRRYFPVKSGPLNQNRPSPLLPILAAMEGDESVTAAADLRFLSFLFYARASNDSVSLLLFFFFFLSALNIVWRVRAFFTRRRVIGKFRLSGFPYRNSR